MTSSFGLTGIGTLLAGIVLMLAVSAATIALWSRLASLGGWVWPVRASLFGLSQLSVVVVTALALNNAMVFYQSWSELFGAHPSQDQPLAAAGAIDARYAPLFTANWKRGVGTVIPLAIPGTVSGVHTNPGLVYLPPQYGDPAYRDRTFPVVELLDGFPGSPATWTHTFHLASVLTGLITAGRAAPFVAVMPEQNVASPRDTECVNVPKGPQVDTYLTRDVRAAVRHSLRVESAGAGWTVLGYSTGGFCATDLALRHPTMFAAAASLEGYNAPAHDSTTQNLFAGDPAAVHQYTSGWLLQHHPKETGHLLVISSLGDHFSHRTAIQLAAESLRSMVSVSTLTLPRGGHNFATISAELPSAIGWLSRYVSAPLAPIPTVDGMTPQPAHPVHPGSPIRPGRTDGSLTSAAGRARGR